MFLLHYIFLLFISSACSLRSEVMKSSHFNGSTFFNPSGDQLKSFWDVMKWKMTSKRKEWKSPSHYDSLWPIRGESKERFKNSLRNQFKIHKSTLTFINHASFLIHLNDLVVLTDPIFSRFASPVSFAGPERVKASGLKIENISAVHVVLISHNHYDHLDMDSLKSLKKKFDPLFLVPLGDEKLLRKSGIEKVKSLDWWDQVKVKNTVITFTPAKHWSARGLWDKNKSLWGSYYLSSPSLKIYFAGDTGWDDHFQQIRKTLGAPDLSLIPIGAYMPRWFMKTYHINPQEAVRAHKELKARLTIPMHYGTFQLGDEPYDKPLQDLLQAIKKQGGAVDEFLILSEGESL